MPTEFDLSDEDEYREACEAIGGEMVEVRPQGAPGTFEACHVELHEVRDEETGHAFLWDDMMGSGPAVEIVGDPPYDEGAPVPVSGFASTVVGAPDDSTVMIDRMNEFEVEIHGEGGNITLTTTADFEDTFKYR
jgi:hypothetical protein